MLHTIEIHTESAEKVLWPHDSMVDVDLEKHNHGTE